MTTRRDVAPPTYDPAGGLPSYDPASVRAWKHQQAVEFQGSNPHCCAITGKKMVDPVYLPADGLFYEREAITKYVRAKGTSPVTGQRMSVAQLREAPDLKAEIEALSGPGDGISCWFDAHMTRDLTNWQVVGVQKRRFVFVACRDVSRCSDVDVLKGRLRSVAPGLDLDRLLVAIDTMPTADTPALSLGTFQPQRDTSTR
jgi:hypothetical protein